MPKAARKRTLRAPSFVQRLKRELRAKRKAQTAALRSTARDLKSLGVGHKTGTKRCLKC